MTKPESKLPATPASKAAEEAKLGIVRPRNREARLAREKKLPSPALRSVKAARRLPAPGTEGRDKLVAKTKASARAKQSAGTAPAASAKSAPAAAAPVSETKTET